MPGAARLWYNTDMPIVMKNVTYKYMRNTQLERAALRDVSLRVGEGEFVGVIGRTGSGKSTLIQHFNGLLKPDAGTVEVDGVATAGRRLRELRRKVGLVFQFPEYQLFEETVFKDIAFGVAKLGLGEGEVRERVLGAAEAAGFPEQMLGRSPFELSGGQRRRAAIAGVLVMEPKYLIMDEPASGLDPAGREELFEYVSQLRAEKGTCVVLVSHNMDDIARYARRVVVMDGGRITMDGAPEDVFTRILELEQAGLRPPDIQYFMRRFKETVAPGIDGRALTVRDAAELVDKWLWAARAAGAAGGCGCGGGGATTTTFAEEGA